MPNPRWECCYVRADVSAAVQARSLQGKVLVVVHKEHGFRALLHTLVTLLGGGKAVRAQADGGGDAQGGDKAEEESEAYAQQLRIASWPPADKAGRCRGVGSCRCALHRFNCSTTNLQGEDIQVMVIDAKEVRTRPFSPSANPASRLTAV